MNQTYDKGTPMKLYDSQGAPNPRRVRMFMAEKGISCENQQFNIVKGENLDPAFLAKSPRGMLPALELDDGTVIDETIAICRYFEETQPEPPLMGTDPKSKAIITSRERQMEFDGLLSAADAFRNSFPGFAKRGLGGSVGSVEAIPALAERGKAMVSRFYENLDKQLANSTYVAGDEFSIADITALCSIDFAQGAARVPMPESCKNLRRWYDAVSARPSAKA
jgi:glutathione S-transferase